MEKFSGGNFGKNMVVFYSFFAKKAFDEQENPVQVLIVFL
jgi:hypothetical protein